MIDNEKNIIPENESVVENKEVRNNPSIDEVSFADEYKSAPDNEKTAREIKPNRVNKTLGISFSVAAAVGAATFGITNLVNVKMTANFNEVNYQDGFISYVINVSNMTEKDKLLSYLYDGDTLISTNELIDDDNDGIIMGQFDISSAYIDEIQSQINTPKEFKLDLEGTIGLDIKRSFDSYKIQVAKYESSIDEVTYWCSCGEDGYYNFKIDYDDPLNMFEAFEAYIIDSLYVEGEDLSEDVIKENQKHISYCSFTDNSHDAQKIYVRTLKGAVGKIFISYYNPTTETREFIKCDNGGTFEDNYKNIKF